MAEGWKGCSEEENRDHEDQGKYGTISEPLLPLDFKILAIWAVLKEASLRRTVYPKVQEAARLFMENGWNYYVQKPAYNFWMNNICQTMSFHVTVLKYPKMHLCFLIIPHARKISEGFFFLGFFPLSFNKLGHLTRNFGHAGWIFPNKDITVVSWQYQRKNWGPQKLEPRGEWCQTHRVWLSVAALPFSPCVCFVKDKCLSIPRPQFPELSKGNTRASWDFQKVCGS